MQIQSSRLMRLALFGAFVSATTIAAVDQQSQLSASERKKIHSGYFSGQHGEIDRQLAATVGDVEFETYQGSEPPNYAATAKEIAEIHGCGADAIVIAIPKASSSEASQFGQTVFTTWEMQVDDILKLPRTQKLQWRARISVLLNGGTVNVGTRKVTVKNPDFPRLTIGKPYLLFLRLVPKTGAYLPWFLLDVSGERLANVRPGAFPALEKVPTDEFLSLLRSDVIPTMLSTGKCSKAN